MSEDVVQLNVRIPKDVKELLEKLSEKYGIREGVIISTLVGMAETYNLLEPNWTERFIQSHLEEFEKKLEIKADVELERRKFDWKMKFKFMMVKDYLDVLSPEERRGFIEEVMGYMKSTQFFELIMDLEPVKINGKTKLVRVSEEGKPKVSGEVVQCPEGWHIKGRRCECSKWRNCEVRTQEYAEFLAKKKLGIR